jgi:hypothetical protein
MIDLLPPQLLQSLRDRYLAGVADAEFFYSQNSADEDAVTGALGQALAMRDPVIFSNGRQQYQLQVSYRKVRGRGPNAAEKRFGIDGVFQIRITDQYDEVVRQKALPFQAKMNWRGKNKDLAVQAGKMEVLQGGIVIDYTPTGYSACPSKAVFASHGSRPQVERFGVVRPLGQVLANDFLNCTVGKIGAFYESDDSLGVIAEFLGGAHVVTTSIHALGPDAA